ncbi:MAG: 1-acyl-sn-glycerol-3-phosphate acyltransferase [Chloroflexi bacterium]|nr:MAG: 1-acyl-sn-glycerol-3-phosphate acyltransferase [Chloroflexota bacterium]
MWRKAGRWVVIGIGRLLAKILFKLTIIGQENLPPNGPLIIISNHFSWFEPALLGLYLPYPITFMAANELLNHPLFRLITLPLDIIPVRRGQPDRQAIQAALQTLHKNGYLSIFPEGGIDPNLQERLARGETIPLDEGQNSRHSAQLIPARPGAAYLAVKSQSPILPVTFLGTEKAMANIRRGRRTPVTMTIGPCFGPLTLPKLPSRKRKEQLNQLGDEMMRHLATLLPPENRGPYAN